MKNKLYKIVSIFVIALIVSTVKVYIGDHRYTVSREDFHSYIQILKQQSDFAAFDYWLGLTVNNTGRTIQQFNLELHNETCNYSRKMSKRPSLGREAGYYASLKSDIDKLYTAFREAGFSYASGTTNNLDMLIAGF